MEVKLEEYRQVATSLRQLTDVRFKLLALVPTVSGGAIALLTKDLEAFKASPIPRSAVAMMAFIVLLGVVFYDVRNSQLYNRLIERGGSLEKELGIIGPFASREPRTLRLFGVITVWHDRGLALIYGTVLGAWSFPIVCGILWSIPSERRPNNPVFWAFVSALVAGATFVAELHRLDRVATKRKEPAAADAEAVPLKDAA